MQDITKDELILLFKETGIEDLKLLHDPSITVNNLLSHLYKYKITPSPEFYIHLSDRLGLEYMEDDDLFSRVDAGCLLPITVAQEGQIILLDTKPTYMRVATSNPLNDQIFSNLSDFFKKKIEIVVVSSKAIDTVSDSCFKKTHGYSALMELVDRQPDESAYILLVPWQKVIIVTIAVLIGLALVLNPFFTCFIFFTLINVSYFIINPVKYYISVQGMAGTKRVIYVTDEELAGLKDEDLPVFTILVPLYKEPEMLPHIMKNISNLDYPHDKLDVKILMEEDDETTLEKARKLGLFGYAEEIISPMTLEEHRKFLSIFHPVVAPDAEVKTKPRACNYGLKRARGEYVVIYDAEDYPDRDQLKKAVIGFSKVGPEYACIQCLLNFYNSRKNILTRWFTVEYSYYYDYYITGLDKINAPIPLGGTSNHFRVKTLRELGGWDPFNVTEDADLGMRIARKKYKTGVLNSHTYEEATTNVRSWIKQRSRWVKGFVITWLVTMRHPIKVFKDTGLKNYIIFHLGFGGNFYLPMMNVILWIVFIVGFISPDLFSRWFDFWPFAVVAVFNLLLGNLFFLTLNLLATYREKQYDLLLYSLFSPIYWVLMSIGAWKGFLQLITKPYKWEKTMHGQTMNEKGENVEKLINDEKKRLSRSYKSIEVPFPEVSRGRTKASPIQISVSIGISIILLLLALIITGFIAYGPISDHVTINKVPGLEQALSPVQAYLRGDTVNFLNFEAIIKPNETGPNLSISPIITELKLPSSK
jgi:glycosyltransferase XagB